MKQWNLARIQKHRNYQVFLFRFENFVLFFFRLDPIWKYNRGEEMTKYNSCTLSIIIISLNSTMWIVYHTKCRIYVAECKLHVNIICVWESPQCNRNANTWFCSCCCLSMYFLLVFVWMYVCGSVCVSFLFRYNVLISEHFNFFSPLF